MIRREDIQAKDILCSRGKGVSNNPGNTFYIEVVKEHRNSYHEASGWKGKQAVVQKVVDILKNGDPPGRFFTVCDQSDEHWQQLNDEVKIARKVAQALRERPKSKTTRNSTKEGTAGGSGDNKKEHNLTAPPMHEPSLKTSQISSNGDSPPDKSRLARTIERDKLADTDNLPHENDGRKLKPPRKKVLKRRRTHTEKRTTSDGSNVETALSECGHAVVSNDGNGVKDDEVSQNNQESTEDNDWFERNYPVNDLRILNPGFRFPGGKNSDESAFHIISVDDDLELNAFLLDGESGTHNNSDVQPPPSKDHVSLVPPLFKDRDEISDEYEPS